MRLSDQGVLGHQLTRRLGTNDHRDELRRHALLSSDLLSAAIDVGSGDIVPSNARIDAPACGIREAVKDSRDQGDHHHHGDDDQQAAEDKLLRLGGRLKKLNHWLRMDSRQDCRISEL